MNHATKPVITATPMTPPTTPPAIAPAFDLLFGNDDCAREDVSSAVVDDGACEDIPGVIVNWLLVVVLVELGTLEVLPVTSGESVIESDSTVHKKCDSLAQIRTADNLRQ